MKNFKSIQGQRLDFNGKPFHWQHRFLIPLGIPNPIANSSWGNTNYKRMNTGCFEGGMFHRDIVTRIGIPDARFFIYWDDSIYGYMAAKIEKAVLVKDLIMKRTRQINQLSLGKRHLNSTSDLVRYNMMKNRSYMKNYFKLYNDYNPVLFGIGTLLTFVKEFIRLVKIDKTYKSSTKALIKGYKEYRRLNKINWTPNLHPLEDGQTYNDRQK
jgi:GT2 family glycosyltransferase